MLIRKFAYAKINLFLELLGVRSDGFHEIDTIVSQISLSDVLLFRSRDISEPILSLTSDSSIRDSHFPLDHTNIIVKAVRLLEKEMGRELPVRILLTKKIPVGAGLGGGSGDAAATLRGVNQFCRLNISSERLSELAAELGSDVPLFLGGVWSRCRGRGELIHSLPAIEPFHFVLIKPPFSLDTKEVYAAFDRINCSALRDGFSCNRSSAVSAEPMLELLRRWGNESRQSVQGSDVAPTTIPSWRLLSEHCFNRLEQATFEQAPELVSVKEQVESITNRKVFLSGSGPTFYLFATNRGEAQSLTTLVQHYFADFFVMAVSSGL